MNIHVYVREMRQGGYVQADDRLDEDSACTQLRTRGSALSTGPSRSYDRGMLGVADLVEICNMAVHVFSVARFVLPFFEARFAIIVVIIIILVIEWITVGVDPSIAARKPAL